MGEGGGGVGPFEEFLADPVGGGLVEWLRRKVERKAGELNWTGLNWTKIYVPCE